MWALELYRSNRCHCGTDPIGSPPEEALLGNTSRVKWCRISEAPIIFHAALFGVLNSPESDPSRRIAAGDECPRVHPSLETSPSDTHVRRPSSSITCCPPLTPFPLKHDAKHIKVEVMCSRRRCLRGFSACLPSSMRQVNPLTPPHLIFSCHFVPTFFFLPHLNYLFLLSPFLFLSVLHSNLY